MLQDGQRLGEFEILIKLGQGGMGAVYKARQTVLRRLVAIKTLQPSLASDAEFVSRFHNEAIAAAGLNHPNLVQVYAAGENEGIHWFAMEFVDGESVQARLQRLGKLAAAEALAIGMHVQTALEHGWRKAQLIHRDIKPDNIFLSNDGEVKLGDLGLAKSSDQQQGLTMTGASMGTPLYISPEQAEGKRDIDLRTDIYSLGATLYHLIAGTPPYTGESAISVMMKHVGAPVPDIRETDPSLPPALATLLARMLQKAPADRYGSYEELGTALQQAYAALTLPSAGASEPASGNEPDRSGATLKKKRPEWLLSALALPLVAIGAFALLKSKAPAPQQNAPSGAPEATAAAASPTTKAEAANAPTKSATQAPLTEGKSEPVPEVASPKELLRKLEAKLLPVPGTGVLMSKTELTVGEWKAYLNAAKLPAWTAPKEFPQTDEHPVVEVSPRKAVEFCVWLSAQSNMTWRLPTDQEWDAASPSEYPWGNYFPPNWNDGNYALSTTGTLDSLKIGSDAIFGTAPVGSFKANPLGFYDLGGNAAEWARHDGSHFHLRGLGWMDPGAGFDTATFKSNYLRKNRLGSPFILAEDSATPNRGFRLVRVKTGADQTASALTSNTSTPVASEKTETQQATSAPPAPAPAQKLPTIQPAETPEDTTPKPPKGFRTLFDGTTLNGWRGLNPHEVLNATPDQKTALVQRQAQEFPKHWRIQNGELINSGTGPYATTHEAFGNIELLIEYKVAVNADGGIYLRGTPQIRIWDTTQRSTADARPGLGSGGLSDNTPGALGRHPLVHADKPLGQWNQLRIRQIGARTWVWLNEVQVVDGALWEPFWDTNKPLPEKAPILLRTEKAEVRWRNIFVRELPDAEASEMMRVWNTTHPTKKYSPPKTPVDELVQRLEAKLLPVPGTRVQMSKTEVTVGEWKTYLQDTGQPNWTQPEKEWVQTDEHPVVMVDNAMAKAFCAWLSSKTAREWRLPSVAEWEAAVGKFKYPWGDYASPKWDDGNFSFLENGTKDPWSVGADGIRGTAPVASFKPNALGFYDLGGNAMEWMLDVEAGRNRRCALRGGGWRDPLRNIEVASNLFEGSSHRSNNIGFRIVRQNAP